MLIKFIFYTTFLKFKGPLQEQQKDPLSLDSGSLPEGAYFIKTKPKTSKTYIKKYKYIKI